MNPGKSLPGALCILRTHNRAETLWPGMHQSEECCVTSLGSRGWRPGMETGPRWPGNVLINSTWGVLSPRQSLSPPHRLPAPNPGRDQQWRMPHVSPRASSVPALPAGLCRRLAANITAAGLAPRRKINVWLWPPGSHCRSGGKGTGAGTDLGSKNSLPRPGSHCSDQVTWVQGQCSINLGFLISPMGWEKGGQSSGPGEWRPLLSPRNPI